MDAKVRGPTFSFLKIARGSLNEAETHILIAQRLGLIEDERVTALLITAESIGKMLNGLMKSLAVRKEAEGI
jgi:four helix bundle protein